MRHFEVELKFLIPSHTDFTKLCEWCIQQNPERIEYIDSPDIYYKNGTEVVRHRKDNEAAGTLTVKKRTSQDSIINRLEVDLHFGYETSSADVGAFLSAIGYEQELIITKKAGIYWLKHAGLSVTAVCYTANAMFVGTDLELPEIQVFELEVEKEDYISVEASEIILKDLRAKLDNRFPGILGEPSKLSLYEIFSGNRYMMAKEE